MSQNLWKKVQMLVLVREYKNNKEIRNCIRMHFDLTFFPISCIYEGLKIIFNKISALKNSKVESLKIFHHYFLEVLWAILNVKSLFFLQFFSSCYEKTLFRAPRTTNIGVAWHRSFNACHENAHPNIGKFINTLQKQE